MRLLSIFITAFLLLGPWAALELGAAPGPPYKVGIFTHNLHGSLDSDDHTDLFAKNINRFWPDDRVEVRLFPSDSDLKPKVVKSLLLSLGDDPRLRAVVVSEAPMGSIEGLAKLRLRRPEILVFVIDPHEDIQRMAKASTLTFSLNHSARGFIYPTMAQRMGARSLVLLSFPRHMEMPHFARTRRIMAQVARDMGMILVTDLNGPDPLTGPADQAELETFLQKTMDRYLEQYGPQTAFVSTSTAYSELIVPLAMQKGGKILPAVQSSLILGYPQALDLVEEAGVLFGRWKRLLALEDEKIMSLEPKDEFAVWTYPYPHTAILAMTDLAVRAIENKINIYDMRTIGATLVKYSPGAKWLIGTHLDYSTDALVPQVFLLLQDSYWFGHGYQGFTRLHIPNRYFRIK